MNPQDVAHHLLSGTTFCRFSFGQGVFVLHFSRWARAELDGRPLPADIAVEVQGELGIDSIRPWAEMRTVYPDLPGGDDAVRSAILTALAGSGDDAVVSAVVLQGADLVLSFAGGLKMWVSRMPGNILPDWTVVDSPPALPIANSWSVFSEGGHVGVRS